MPRLSPSVRTIGHLALFQALLLAQVGITVYLSRATAAPLRTEEQVAMRISPPAPPPEVERREALSDAAPRFTEPFEGRRRRAYRDTAGHLTIGVGFNLDRNGAERDLRAVLGEIDVAGLRSGDVMLTDAEIDALFRHDMDAAIVRARREVSGFDRLPREAQLIVVDMTFNLGSLSGWPNFRRALGSGNYAAAAAHMADSRWSKQTGRRAASHIAMMQQLGDQQQAATVASR